MRQHEKQGDMSLPQILEDIHTEEDIEKYSDFDLEKGLDIDEAYNRMGEEHCDICPVRRLI